RRPRLHHLQRARPRGEARAGLRQAGAVRDQPRFRQRHRRARGRVCGRPARYRIQLALPARHRRPARGRGRGLEACRSRLADAGTGQGQQERALRADADAGVTLVIADKNSSSPGLTRRSIYFEMTYWVYILASKPGGTLYVGVTNNLIRRVYEYREGLAEGFTKRYSVKMLVYFEPHETIEAAIQTREEYQALVT